jgi:glutathionylspermidine synthase
MQRITCPERDDWRITADETGFDFHTIDDERYWDERAYYAFTLDEIERRIEEPTGEIDAMCLELVARAIDDESYLHRLKIPEAFWPLIAESWYRDEASLNGRLDFCFDGHGPAKLLEYNADTPTSIFEAAVFQWKWLEQAIERRIIPSHADQFNSIHERLIEAWKKLGEGRHLHLAGVTENAEDAGTLAYLEDTARQAGLATTLIDIEDIGCRDGGCFVDLDDRAIELAFKLYPWEWMFHERLARSLSKRRHAGSNRHGRPSFPTRAFFRCCGKCFRITPICCLLFSRMIRTRRGSAPPLCASQFIRAKAPT